MFGGPEPAGRALPWSLDRPPGGDHDGRNLRPECCDNVRSVRTHTVPPRASLELGRLDDTAAKHADRVGLTDSVLFHLVERVVGENDLAAREDCPQEPPGFRGPQRLCDW